jgi:hypothetical protein
MGRQRKLGLIDSVVFSHMTLRLSATQMRSRLVLPRTHRSSWQKICLDISVPGVQTDGYGRKVRRQRKVGLVGSGVLSHMKSRLSATQMTSRMVWPRNGGSGFDVQTPFTRRAGKTFQECRFISRLSWRRTSSWRRTTWPGRTENVAATSCTGELPLRLHRALAVHTIAITGLGRYTLQIPHALLTHQRASSSDLRL